MGKNRTIYYLDKLESLNFRRGVWGNGGAEDAMLYAAVSDIKWGMFST